MLLEVAVFNLPSALAAARVGAHRIEFCDNAQEGGTTPSYGVLKTLREKITLPVFPIIRPHGGDFLYTEEEFVAMKHDVQLCKDLHFEGVVLGLLQSNGDVDVIRTAKLVSLAYPMQVTFHRAFDRAKNSFEAMEQIIQCGCNRILTSGQVARAFDGKKLIKQLVQVANGRIIILPGSGIRSNNILPLAQYTGVQELHTSARCFTESRMLYLNKKMNENLDTVAVDSKEIANMLLALKSLQ